MRTSTARFRWRKCIMVAGLTDLTTRELLFSAQRAADAFTLVLLETPLPSFLIPF